MPKTRDKFKEAAARAKKEDALGSKNMFGVADPTPKEAVRRIKEGR